MKLKKFKGGVHPEGHKEITERLAVVESRAPDRVWIPLQQHIGAPCEPLVKKGDQVKKGQKIGESEGFVSAPVHASVSGTVAAVEPYYHPLGAKVPALAIESDGEEAWSEEVKPPGKALEDMDSREIIQLIREAGIVGMGGAAFPAHVKLSPPEDKPIDTFILNGAECEPYLTADHRTMLESADEVLFGMKAMMKALGVQKGIIGIEKNKPDAIKEMKEKVRNEEGIEVFPLPTLYPQGAEKMLIQVITGRQVPSGGLPLDVGVVNQNVGTSRAVARAIQKGEPLIERPLTVTGSGIKSPANLMVKVGTRVKEIIEQCQGLTEDARKIIIGGPMMGLSQPDMDIPVLKGTSGVLVLTEQEISWENISPCIRCARCVDACPMNLLPNFLGTAGEKELLDQAEDYHVLDCIECGCCTYVCPASRPLTQWIKLAKAEITAKKKKSS